MKEGERMSEYQLKTGKISKAVTGAYKKVEGAFVETFLEKPEDGEGTGSLKTGKVGEAVVSAYKAIEEAAVNGYKKVEGAFVDTFLEKREDQPSDQGE